MFTATLTHEGSSAIMMIFMGGKDRIGWTRTDARMGEPLEITCQVSQQDIKKVGEEYWTLKVTNFDSENRAAGLLEVNYDAKD